MAWPKGRRILVCGRLADPENTPGPGAIEHACAACGETVTMSLESQFEKATRATPVVCVQCYAEWDAAGNPNRLLRQKRIS